MYLSEYLKEKGLNDTEFAALIGCSIMHISRLRKAQVRMPHSDMMEKIHAETGGKVCDIDFIRAYEDRKQAEAAAKAAHHAGKKRKATASTNKGVKNAKR